MMSKKKYFTLAVIVIILGVAAIWFAQRPAEKEIIEEKISDPGRFIVANPFDLTQIQGFSKYRSCEGHDYRYPTLTGEMEAAPRSMKHYVVAKQEFRGTIDRVNAFAPFDGKISEVRDEISSGSEVWLTPNQPGASGWRFVFFHLTLDENIQEDASVTAGQHIGTAYLRRGPDGTTDNFDIALRFLRPMRQPAVDAPFNHAAQNVLDEYKKYGVNADDFIISKEERDIRPCLISSERNGPDITFPPGRMADDYVWLVPPI